ncbi:hypothetical protein D3C83_55540 [compost metagenome]
MDDARARRRMAPALGGHRTCAAAHEDDQVGLRERFARGQRAAVRADHAETERVVFGQAALAADGGRDRRAEQLRERGELVFRVGDHHAAAADENRQSCGGQELCGFRDLFFFR